MIRSLLLAAGLAFGLSGAALAQSEAAKTPKKPAAAQKDAGHKAKTGASSAKEGDGKAKPGSGKSGAGASNGKSAKGKTDGKAASGKPTLSGAFGDWGAYVSHGSGKAKTCYALARPKSRSGAAQGGGFIFIATRPAENVRGEISIMMGAPLKEGVAGGSAELGSETFALVAKGQNAWVKDTAEEKQLADAMRKGSKLVVKAPSAKGAMIVDTYSLNGLGQALDQVRKDCN
jgi:invasion protein IalB